MSTDAPKFWHAKKKRVVEGVDIRKTPTQLADVLGTYIWVYSGDPEFGGEVEEYRNSYKDEKEFITEHMVKLEAEKPDSSQPVTPEKVNGHVTWGTAKITFEGMRLVREGWSSDAAAPWMESNWELLLTENGDGENNGPWLDEEGNMVGAAVVLDDNGFPFLVFDWSHPPGCHSSWSGYYVGKRLVEGKGWRMSHAERGRLGIGKSVKRVARSVKEGSSKEENEENEEEDSDREEDEDEEEDSDEEEDVSGSSEEDVSEDVGKKRKVGNGQTDGANKRRRT